jgi:sialate O-acetylesterase
MFTVAKGGTPEPAEDAKGAWLTINRENLLVDGENGASVLAYFFGRELFQKLNIPVGLINTSVGGTPAEKWTKREALEANPDLKALSGKGGSSTLYNAMIAPLIPYAIRGAIWYQGESNLDRAYQYRTLFPAMIAHPITPLSWSLPVPGRTNKVPVCFTKFFSSFNNHDHFNLNHTASSLRRNQ